ncbi:MAG: TetR/AcrR family transcriptional regulator [Bacillus sp. (in: firmicutes)]
MDTELKDKIIQSSLELFAKHGYHGVSVHQIVQHSGTSKGGFYHHFESKEELLYVIHDYFISYVLQKAEQIQLLQLTPTERLQKIIYSFVKTFDLYQQHITIFYQESFYVKPQYVENIAKKRNRFKAIIYGVLQEGIRQGEFRAELVTKITTMSILGMVNWTYKWYRADGEKSIDEIAFYYADFIFQALWTEKTRHNPAYASFQLKHIHKQK